MAARLKSRIGKTDLIAASPARRTTLTSDFFCDEFGYSKDDIKFIPTTRVGRLYRTPLFSI
jgi:phosphohistidine phosphatase SixA